MDAVFGVLSESSLRATIMVIAVMIILWALRVMSPTVQHRAWTGVLVAMLVLPLLSSWAPRILVPILPAVPTVVQVASDAQPASKAVSGSFVPGSIQVAVNPVFSASSQPLPQAGGRGYQWGVYEIAIVAYLLGFLILMARLFVGWVLAARLAPETSRDGRPFHTSRCKAPLSVGLFRPRILLPMESKNWDSEKLGAVLAHEQAHVRRRDPLIEWLAMFNRCLHWFNPLAWWLNRKLAALAEQACDEAVLAQGYDPAGYAELLLEFARSVKRCGTLVTIWGSSIHGSALATRISRILTKGRSPAPSRIQIAMVLAFCANAVLLSAFVTLARTPAALSIPQGDGLIRSEVAEPAGDPKPASPQTNPGSGGNPSNAARQRVVPQPEAPQSDGLLLQTGKELLDRGQFSDARLAFKTLIRSYPGSPLEPEAYYAMGESFRNQGGKANLLMAKDQYRNFIIFFPSNPKAPDAQLRIISILMRQMQQESEGGKEAERALVEIRRFLILFPNSEYIPIVKQYEEEVNRKLSERNPRFAPAANEGRTDSAQGSVLTEAYRKWLREEVVYIISKTESDVFMTLKTDAEREHFIGQFWERRNPYPGVADNPEKTEHYRRLAYVNAHFACSIPGWKTDRGRIYIVNGEPDGKESHPTGGWDRREVTGGTGSAGDFPFERWRYDHLAGGGTAEFLFVDKQLDGSFPLVNQASP